MFWNSVLAQCKYILTFYKVRSITSRLTLLFALSTFCALLASSVFLYNLLVEDLYMSDLKISNNEIHLVKEILMTHRGKLILLDPQSTGRKAYYVRVLDDNENTLLETPEMNIEFERSDFPLPPPNEQISKPRTVRSTDGRYYMVQSSTVVMQGQEPQKLIIQLALDTHHHHTLIVKYRLRLLLILITGIIFSAIFGAFIAFRGMRPLRKMTQSIAAISASRLDERLNTTDCPLELTSLAEAFNQMLSRLENSFNQLKQFSADIAHELRTPIHHLVVETEICLSKARSIEQYQETLQSSLEEYSRLGQLIDRLLFLARAENPNTAINPVTLDIKQEFSAILDFFEAASDEKHITLQAEGEGEIKADPVLFRRAVTNLISNAIKYTPEKGEIKLTAKIDNDYEVIQVSDSGIGIDEAHLPFLFDRFYRVDSSRSKHGGGHGLGLAIVKSIMDLHRGKVTVTSVSGVGTVFNLFFPK